MGDERRLRRRELRVVGRRSTGTLCDGMVGSDGKTAARIELGEIGKEASVLVGWCGIFGMAGSSVADGAVVFGMLSSARSTGRQCRRTWRN